MARVRTSSVLLAAYWLAIFLATHVRRPMPSLGDITYLDKVAHFVAFAGLTTLMAWTWHGRRAPPVRALIVCWAVAALYGIVDEWTQSFVPNRRADIVDYLADLAGAAFGLVIHAGWSALAPGRASNWESEADSPTR